MRMNIRAGRNRTLTLSSQEQARYRSRLLRIQSAVSLEEIIDKTIQANMSKILPFLPPSFADLLFLDPPYNIPKQFHNHFFQKKSMHGYVDWVDEWMTPLIRLLKPDATVFICCDWQCSPAIHEVARRHFKIRNRITWEREKGRGASNNWKNSMEDIWFCTRSNQYTFNVNAVKLKRRVLAPYTQRNGDPKDWEKSEEGNYRLTHPSNLWTDITVPFWSMPENTDHPTQKPEKLLAKLILACSHPGDVVFDPFLGSGTTAVVAKKLQRRYVGIELEEIYCCYAEKRLELADSDSAIQGYRDGVFWERNSLPALPKNKGKDKM